MDDRIAKPPPPGMAIASDRWTAPFWDAAASHMLRLPRCISCGRFRFPPTAFCPYCNAQQVDWVAAPGAPILYSYTVVERAIVAGTEASLPYVPAVVEFPMADGVRLITNIVAAPLSAIAVGSALRLAWIDLPSGGAIPVFEIEGLESHGPG